jgi:hypothetical protein
MALSKDVVLNQIEIMEDGVMQLRYATYIVEDGERITDPKYHRMVIEPGDNYSQAPPRVRAIADVVHTPAVIKAYRDKRAAEGLRVDGQVTRI